MHPLVEAMEVYAIDGGAPIKRKDIRSCGDCGIRFCADESRNSNDLCIVCAYTAWEKRQREYKRASQKTYRSKDYHKKYRERNRDEMNKKQREYRRKRREAGLNG